MSDNNYRFNAPVAVSSNNRVNTSGRPIANPQFKTSLRIVQAIDAGATLQLSCSGTQFYFRFSTGILSVKPSGGAFADYQSGEGLNVPPENAFSLLQLKNNNSVAVVFELFAGFDGFIDNKLVLSQSINPNVVYPTYPTAGVATSVDINDISGQPFYDINGNQWYAISRVAILVSNVSSGTTILLLKKNGTNSGDPAIMAIFPLTSIRLDASGDYSLYDAGNVDCIVSEIYSAIAPT